MHYHTSYNICVTVPEVTQRSTCVSAVPRDVLHVRGKPITVWGVRKATCVSNTPVCFSALQDTLQRMEYVRCVQTLAPNVTKGANAVVSFSTLFITDWHFIIITTKLYNWLLSRASEFLHSYTTGNVFKRSLFCSSIIHFIKNNTVKTEIFSNIIKI